MFQDVLKALIAERGVSVVRVARELGIPKTLLYEWRAGIRMPGANHLRRLSQYFGVSIGALLEEEGDAEQEQPIRELSVLFRQASRLSADDQLALVQAMRENLKGYLGACGEEEK